MTTEAQATQRCCPILTAGRLMAITLRAPNAMPKDIGMTCMGSQCFWFKRELQTSAMQRVNDKVIPSVTIEHCWCGIAGPL